MYGIKVLGYIFKLQVAFVWRGCCTTVHVLKVLIWKVIGVFVCSWTWQLIAGCSQRAPVVFVCTHVCFCTRMSICGRLVNLALCGCTSSAHIVFCFVCVCVCSRLACWYCQSPHAVSHYALILSHGELQPSRVQCLQGDSWDVLEPKRKAWLAVPVWSVHCDWLNGIYVVKMMPFLHQSKWVG